MQAETTTPLVEDETRIPLIEEELRVDTRETVTGRVRVETRTDLVEEVVKAELATGSVSVERVAVDREITEMPDIRTEGDTVIVPVVEEVLVVERRLVLKEELHVRRNVSTESVEVPVTLRKQRAHVVRTPVDENETTSED